MRFGRLYEFYAHAYADIRGMTENESQTLGISPL